MDHHDDSKPTVTIVVWVASFRMSIVLTVFVRS